MKKLMINWVLKKLGYISRRSHEREIKGMKNPYNNGDRGGHLRIKQKSGNTTRTIDLAIQDFFKNRRVTFDDHHKTMENRRRVMKMFLHRLQVEHGIRREDLNFSVSSKGIHVSFRNKVRVSISRK